MVRVVEEGQEILAMPSPRSSWQKVSEDQEQFQNNNTDDDDDWLELKEVILNLVYCFEQNS